MGRPEERDAVPAAHAQRHLSSLIRRALRARTIRAALAITGVATSTLLVMVLFAAFRSPVFSISEYLDRPGMDVWVMPNGTDNLVRTAGFLPVSLVDGIRELEGVAAADPLVRVFVRVTPHRPHSTSERSLMQLALGYRVPDGLGGPPGLAAGRAPHGDGEIALDRAAAFRLGLALGDTVMVNDRSSVVVGLTRQTNLLITQLLFFDFSVGEHTSGLLDQTSFVVVRTADVPAVMARIRDEFPRATVLARPEFLRNSVREAASGFIPILTLIAALGVLASALLVALMIQGLVEDRRPDIAVLLAMGVGIPQIGAALIAHAVILVACGGLIGTIVSRGLQLALDRFLPTVQLSFAPGDVALALLAMGAAGVAAAWVPVLRLRNIDPLEALRT